MGFFKNLFGKKKKEFELRDTEWDRVQGEKSELNMKDPLVREQYVINCLEQMRESSAELDRINNEYAVVTSYLTDMEDIDSITGEDRNYIESVAKHLHDLRKAHDNYVLTPSLMTTEEYDKMEQMEDEIEEGLTKISEQEEYRDKVKRDLSRIDKEKGAYEYRRHEVNTAIANARGTASIVMVAAVVLTVALVAIQLAFDFNVTIGYYITIILVAASVTVIYLRYTERVSEKKKIDNTVNELILLENKVKIRYVNNRNLLDYLYTKYDVTSAAQLKDLAERYKKEKVARTNFERNEVAYQEELERLVRTLQKNKIRNPEIWMHQSDAIYDSREMVEIRHRLIGRRQKLRKQLEYNEQIALEAGDEIKKIIKEYPDYADSVLRLVDQYES